MKAMHPDCGGKGCDKCNQTGFWEIHFASGALYTNHCNACGEDNGGSIATKERPITARGKPELCVWCGSEDTEWVLVGSIDAQGHVEESDHA